MDQASRQFFSIGYSFLQGRVYSSLIFDFLIQINSQFLEENYFLFIVILKLF